MGVIDEDVGHPAFRPDGDLLEELLAVLNKHQARLRYGNLIGSLLCAVRCVMHARRQGQRPLDAAGARGIIMMAAQYLARPPRRPLDSRAMILDDEG